MWWVKWLKNRVAQGSIFYVIIPAHYTFLVKILLVKLRTFTLQHA